MILSSGGPGDGQREDGEAQSGQEYCVSHYFHHIYKSLVLPAQSEQYVSQRPRHGFAARGFHPQHAAGVELDALARPHDFDESRRVDVGFWMEANGDAGALAFNGGDAQALAHGFEDGVLQEVVDGGGRRAEAVFEFFADVGLFVVGGDGGDALVGAKAEIFTGDVVFGDADVGAEAERGAEVGSGLLAFEFGDGAFEHLAVEVEADGFDVAVLLAAEHVAGAAEFEVESGDAEAGAEFAELFHGGEALAGDVAEGGLRAGREDRRRRAGRSGQRGRGVGKARRGRGDRRD